MIPIQPTEKRKWEKEREREREGKKGTKSSSSSSSRSSIDPFTTQKQTWLRVLSHSVVVISTLTLYVWDVVVVPFTSRVQLVHLVDSHTQKCDDIIGLKRLFVVVLTELVVCDTWKIFLVDSKTVSVKEPKHQLANHDQRQLKSTTQTTTTHNNHLI